VSLKRAAVFYHYFEKNDFYRDNLVYFLSTGYLENIDFYIVISGNCSIKNLPERENIFYINAPNLNFDFGGHAAGINFMRAKYSSYKNYIFINSSVRGPFLNPHSDTPWIDIFINKFSNNTHLVGSSINIPLEGTPEVQRFIDLFPNYESSCAHVQTTAYAMTEEAFNHLLSIDFYNTTILLSRIDVICMYEIRLSQEILRNNWTLECLLPEYNLIDYQSKIIDKSPVLGGNEGAIDKGVFFGRTVSPTEILFIKVNRDSISDLDLYSYTYTGLLRRNNSSIMPWIETKFLEAKSLQWIQAGITNRINRSKNIFYRIFRKLIQ